MSFWDVVWFILITYALVALLMVMFAIISDLFRDKETSGFVKAVWIFALVFLPIVTSLVYLIVRGQAMAERSARSAEAMKQAQDAYIKEVAGKAASPADQIAQARAMLDAGVISEPEYERLKEKALV
ncbi:MAG TPA: SHOCT domain-containing protein [Nocardioidaceae bacterium]|nr:SHOCT domain-containing protein [Nocardioidaceae bacterium]